MSDGILQLPRQSMIAHSFRRKQANPSAQSYPLGRISGPRQPIKDSHLIQGHRQCIYWFHMKPTMTQKEHLAKILLRHYTSRDKEEPWGSSIGLCRGKLRTVWKAYVGYLDAGRGTRVRGDYFKQVPSKLRTIPRIFVTFQVMPRTAWRIYRDTRIYQV